MKYLCIDYGKKKIGVAVSDDSGELAFPCMIVENNKNLLIEIKQACKELKIHEIVMGNSLDQNGIPNPIMKDARAFAVQLENTLDLPLHFEKEFMTTMHARASHGGKEVVDDSAAALILQRFLDRKNKPVAKEDILDDEDGDTGSDD